VAKCECGGKHMDVLPNCKEMPHMPTKLRYDQSASRPSTIANVSGTGGVKSWPTPFGIFPKKKFQIVAADPPYRPRMFNLK
jgi:hypothetical protein